MAWSAGRLFASPGQYAKLAFGDQRPRDFSIASRPDERELEFHVRHSHGGGASAYVARQLRVGDGVWVEGPYGDAWLRADHSGPILAIAGGSGLAPIKSIVETALLAGRHADISLYFGARDRGDLYLDLHFRRLAQRHGNFRYIPVLSEPRAPTTCRVGMVTDAIAADGGGEFRERAPGQPGPHREAIYPAAASFLTGT